MSKYVSFEYLTQNNPCPQGVQFKGLMGDRSIGKTHGVLKYLINKQRDNEAIMILRRNKLELNFVPFVQKYGSAFERDWEIDGNRILENHDTPVIYFSALSLSERGKHENYDSPYVTDIIVDEVFAEKPNKNEFQQLQTWITTLSRRTGHAFHPVTVWLIGNHEYGRSPILEELGVYCENGRKQKTQDGVYLFSDLASPANTINVKSPLIREFEIHDDNHPVLEWTHMKHHYAMYDMGVHMYIKKVTKSKQPFDATIMQMIVKMCVRKKGLPRVFVQDYDCMRFIEHPALKFMI